MNKNRFFYALYLAWIIACLGTIGALYFEQMDHLAPCNLCWYQRMGLFPLVIILGMAAFRGVLKIIPYVLPQIFLGGLVALAQILVQEKIISTSLALCGKGSSCLEKIDLGLGFITPPILSFLAFAAMAILLIYAQKNNKKI